MLSGITTDHPKGMWVLEDEPAEIPTESAAQLAAAKQIQPGERQVSRLNNDNVSVFVCVCLEE